VNGNGRHGFLERSDNDVSGQDTTGVGREMGTIAGAAAAEELAEVQDYAYGIGRRGRMELFGDSHGPAIAEVRVLNHGESGG
jgi:hypothetical protein